MSDLQTRIRDKVDVDDNGCWIVRGVKLGNYAHINVHKTKFKAHRISYIAFKGDIPGSMSVCHTCDVPTCVNPDHLFVGTHKDNMIDRDSKGRGNKRRGDKHYAAKITLETARNIKEAYKLHGCVKAGKMYGVSPQSAHLIGTGKQWKCLNG